MDYRLKKEKDFETVFKKGKRVFSSSLTMIYMEEQTLKAGFAVGKKLGGSVTRNRIKRILRESFRSFLPKIRQNFFFVFIPKTGKEHSLTSAKKDMEFMLKKAGILPFDEKVCPCSTLDG